MSDDLKRRVFTSGRPCRVWLIPLAVVACLVGVLPAGPVMAEPAALSTTVASAASADATSNVFEDGWRFALVNRTGIIDPTGAYADAADPSFDDSSWRTVSVPHDWSIELDPTNAAGTSSGTGYLQGGLGWYRKTFTLPQSLAGHRISVEFDGVYMDSTVYLNGQLVAQHPYGYTGFAADLTALAHTDGSTPNVLAVKVQNQLPSSRWYSGSGIYRHVHLVTTDPVHVARHGVFVTTPDLAKTYAAGYAAVHVATSALDERDAGTQATVVSTVLDASGRRVASGSVAVGLGAQAQTATSDIRVDKPHLWSTGTPYLYTLRTDLVVGRHVVDSVRTSFGIRWVAVDPQGGFSLNGKSMKIQGVDLHHDEGALGAAVNKDALNRQMKIMKSMGVNALRTSHNPPAPELVEVCDELGIVMMVEAFDTWVRPKVTYDYGRFFNANSDSDIQEMVNAAKNSPAVIMWSIGNEIPDSTSVSVGLPIAKRLIGDIKAIDPSRPVVIGSDKYRSVPSDGSGQDLVLRELDGLGLNYNTAVSVDALHAKYPTKFLFESESSSETSTRGAYQDPDQLNTGENYTPGKRATSSYDNNLASWTMSGEYGLKKDRDRSWFMGEFLWSGMDYIGEPTPYNVFPVKSSFFGAVDTAGFPKDLYYLFKSQWTTDPMVHLLPMNWTNHKPGEPVSVWAYSNVDTVELFLNGRSLGVRSFDQKTTTSGKTYLETTEPTGDDKTVTSGAYPGSYTSPNGSAGKLHLSWSVPFAAGKLVAVATKNGKQMARDELSTAGQPSTLRLVPDKKVITADGRSLSYVSVDVVDHHGTMVPDADNAITFAVTGGRLVGVDNGRQEDAENYKSSTRSAFNGKAIAIVQSLPTAGPITIRARAAGLEPADTTVWSVGRDPKVIVAGRPVGVDPVYVRAPVGASPALPAQVTVVNGDGSTSRVAVHWQRYEAQHKPGVTTVTGTIHGLGAKAKAVVTAYEPSRVEPWSTVLPVGTSPTLPPTVRVIYTDGVDRLLPVTWGTVKAGSYASAGTVVVYGRVDGLRMSATAQVRVTADFEPGQNLASAASPTTPSADASYSGSQSTLPSALLDGVAATGGWSNFYSKSATALLPTISRSRGEDWVAVSWPAQQTVGQLRGYFTTSATRSLPSSVRVSYWDGGGWVSVRGVQTDWATISNAPSTISFEQVSTSSIRLEMTSPTPGTSSGSIQIAELEAIGDLLH